MDSNVEIYEKAQIAVNNLKSAVLQILHQHNNNGVQNVAIGKALGIHKTPDGKNEGYVSWHILRLLQAEGLAEQRKSGGKWYPSKTLLAEDSNGE